MVAIGVTENVNKSEINSIASEPIAINAFFIDNFNELLRIVDDIARTACGRGNEPKFDS